MPRVHIRTARRDIYKVGARVANSKTKSGFRRDRSLPADERDEVIVQKGQEYYTWKFQFREACIQLHRPTRSQLTQSAFLQALYELEDRMDDFTATNDVSTNQDAVQEIVDAIRELQQQQEDSLEAMPEALQETSVAGELLRERADALEQWASELEGLDLEMEEGEEEEDYMNRVQSAVQDCTYSL